MTRLLARHVGGASWTTWLVLLKAMFALPLSDHELTVLQRVTGRSASRAQLPGTIGRMQARVGPQSA